MFEAVYISDTNNNLIYEYLINLSSPTFKSLCTVIAGVSNSNDIIEINKNYTVYKFTTSSIIIYTLNLADTNPILPYNFIGRLIEVIYDYFGYPLAIPKIESNNDTLTLLISQMLDDGIPNITDFNRLRDIIPFKSFLSKILTKTNEMTKSSSPAPVIATDNGDDVIPWRRSNVRHTNNEMYVDIIETIDVILKCTSKKADLNRLKQFDSAFYSSNTSTNLYNKNLVPVTGNISGEVNFSCKLTGVPYLQMIMNVQGLQNINPKFHRCVKLDNWNNSRNLSFIPPDGRFQLMKYSIDLNQFDTKNQMSMLGSVNVEYNYGTGANKNDFEVKLYLPIIKGVSKIENLTVEIHTNYPVSTIKSSRLTHGDFSYTSSGKAEWNLRSVPTGVSPILYGTIVTNDVSEDEENTNTKVIKPSYIKLSYTNKGSVPSGIKVESLKILSAKGMSETVKPYKGVKYMTRTGDFVIRS